MIIIRMSKLYYTASGIIKPVGGRPVHRRVVDKIDLKFLITATNVVGILCFRTIRS